MSSSKRPFGKGLSPRVRGNRGSRLGKLEGVRSIPRVCGGTRGFVFVVFLASGLSPRVRGNLSPPNLAYASTRSIPACAGEPEEEG